MAKPLLNEEWLTRLASYQSIFLGFSGGLDSTVLLHVLAQETALRDKLTAVHINHGLSPNAAYWQTHCEQVCQSWNISFLTRQVALPGQANIEEEARRARYDVFKQLIATHDCLLLAHHQNDQAETLFLQLLRGTGIDGLAAMPCQKEFAKGYVLRPFLMHPRLILEEYAASHKLQWIEDESNANTAFSRNYLRQNVIPLLQQRWPTLLANLTRTSLHCQQAQANLNDLALIDYPEQVSDRLNLTILMHLPSHRMMNVLRSWVKHNKVRMPNSLTFSRIYEELVLAAPDATAQVDWADVSIRRYQQSLYLLKENKTVLPESIPWLSFPQDLPLPGQSGYLSPEAADDGLVIPPDSHLEIRFRRGGEQLFWHGQSKILKKLFQQWQIPVWLRDRIPLLYINGQLACVIGYAISDKFYQKNTQAYQIKHLL